jgi:hypothetical protein
MGDLIILVIVAVVAAVGGIRLGMLVAPSIGRLAGGDDDDPADGSPATEPPADGVPTIEIEPPRAEEPRDDA